MKIKDFYNHRRRDWYDHKSIDIKSAQEQHTQNIKALENAKSWREKDSPITITVLHGSGRHPTESCANELSNSELLLERGLELAIADLKAMQHSPEPDPVIWRFKLREMMLEPCNGCVSTASSLCNFPCSCFPADDITTKIYPAIMASDILLWSTPVNQSMVSTRTKTVIDRLISLDGGYFTETLPVKDAKWREKMIELSQEEPVYDQRMFGKVAAYFVTSKDATNTHEESAPYPSEFRRLGYVDFVVGALGHQGTEFGWFHANPHYVVSVSEPDVDYSLDKQYFDRDTKAHKQARDVVISAIRLAARHRDNPPKMGSAGRVNRT